MATIRHVIFAPPRFAEGWRMVCDKKPKQMMVFLDTSVYSASDVRCLVCGMYIPTKHFSRSQDTIVELTPQQDGDTHPMPTLKQIFLCSGTHGAYPKLAVADHAPDPLDPIQIADPEAIYVPGTRVRRRRPKQIGFVPTAVEPLARVTAQPPMFKQLDCMNLMENRCLVGIMLNDFSEEVRFYQELLMQMIQDGTVSVDEVENRFNRVVKLVAMAQAQSYNIETKREAELAGTRALEAAKKLCQQAVFAKEGK